MISVGSLFSLILAKIHKNIVPGSSSKTITRRRPGASQPKSRSKLKRPENTGYM
jgi:hypothetical protein